MGRVAGAYGVRGWVKVVPGGGVQQALADAAEWWIDGRAHRVAEAKTHSATVVARLAEVATREQAAALKGKEVALARSTLPRPEEGFYYLVDLLGLEVVNEQGDKLGVVKQWLTNGAQDVMEVAGERLRLIPWVPTVVKTVDLPGKRVVVEWGADW